MKYARKSGPSKKLVDRIAHWKPLLGQSGEYERITSLATVGAQSVGLGQTRVFWISTGAIFLVYQPTLCVRSRLVIPSDLPRPQLGRLYPDIGRFREITSRHLVTKRTLCTHKTVPIPTWTTQDHRESRFWRLRATLGSPPYTTVDYYLKRSILRICVEVLVS